MPSVTSVPSQSPAVGDLYTLMDERDDSAVVLSPTRGALVTSFSVSGRELLYLDESTLSDATKNVRGGVPVLFPSPGKLENDTWSYKGRSGSMKQHGFARNTAWAVSSTDTTDGAAVTLALSSSDTTRAQYPWDFRARFTFQLRGACLRITEHVENVGSSPMPFGVGFHPYFRVSDKGHARIDTQATRAFDNVTKSVRPFSGFDLTQAEVDLHLLDHGSSTSALHLEDGTRISVRGSSHFDRWVVWTLAGKDFVCLEPWTCPGNALNTGEGLIHLDPKQSFSSWVEIAYAP